MTKRQDLYLQRRSRSEQSDQRQPNQVGATTRLVCTSAAISGVIAFAREDAYLRSTCSGPKATMGGMLMDAPSKEFALAGSLEELKVRARLVVRGGHRPILVMYER